MNSEKVRVNLRRLADLAADGHQDVMDALAALNSSIIKAEEGDWNSIRVKTVERRFKEALNDCGVQQERMERIGEEITAIRQNMRISS
jgi:predicted hydrolase (HD superfamily)